MVVVVVIITIRILRVVALVLGRHVAPAVGAEFRVGAAIISVIISVMVGSFVVVLVVLEPFGAAAVVAVVVLVVIVVAVLVVGSVVMGSVGWRFGDESSGRRLHHTLHDGINPFPTRKTKRVSFFFLVGKVLIPLCKV